MEEFFVDKGAERMQLPAVIELLHGTYWAQTRDSEVIRRSIAHSLCFGVFERATGRQVGFARAITDSATSYYLCDVVIHPDYRGRGLGKRLVGVLAADPELAGLRGLLITQSAQGLYEKYGYRPVTADRTVMYR